jgi:hypothetical protein
LWCVIGRRGGKSRAIAALLVYLATMVDYRAQLVLGERGFVLCLARRQEQSQVVLEYVAGIIEAAPILAKMVIRRAADSLTLFNRGATIVIAVRAASFRSVRGLTCVAAVADEIAFWQAEDGSANPDTEILRAVRPTLLTTHGPLIAISSPYARKGELWTTFKRYYGAQGDPRILVAHAASRDMNPTLRQADIDREMDRDPAAGLAEYYAEFRTDISAFVSQEVIDGCVACGVFELPPAADVSYPGSRRGRRTACEAACRCQSGPTRRRRRRAPGRSCSAGRERSQGSHRVPHLVEFLQGRAEIEAFLTRKWSRELGYRLTKELWVFRENRIAARFTYEWRDDSGHWFRSYGNEIWGVRRERFDARPDRLHQRSGH